MKIQDIVNLLSATANDCFLSEVTIDLSKFDEEIRELLIGFYNSEDKVSVRIATMLNSIFTHQTTTFMYTFETMEKLLDLDTNNRVSTIKTPENTAIRKNLIDNGFMVCLRPSVGRKSGVYKIVYEPWVDMLAKSIGREFLDKKEQKVLEYFDNKGKKKKNPESKRLVDMLKNPDFLKEVEFEKQRELNERQ